MSQTMDSNRPIKFKIATEDWEFELLHRLNYKTFVQEIPQHEPSKERRLVDKFHNENTYIIGLDGKLLAGMIAFRGKRPFSLDQKIPNLDSQLPANRQICEIRLLAVEKPYRNGRVFRGLVEFLAEYGQAQGFDLAIISGTTRQQKLYRHLGFKPFGALIGEPGAQFQPMFLTLETFVEKAKALLEERRKPTRPLVSFLPGPVAIHPEVQKVLGQEPISHRSDEFLMRFQIVKGLLRQITGARQVEIMVGSGTLANDVVGGQLLLEAKPGLILSNGEFGDRLIDHATRLGLVYETCQVKWGDVLDLKAVRQRVERDQTLGWVWAVHCETSTGLLNNLEELKLICASRQLKLCLDCISSIGTVPVNLKGVYLASGVSGKGLAGFPGLAMVFYDHPIKPADKKLPRYLDLGYYAACDGVPFTHSSNLLMALETALGQWNSRRFEEINETSVWLRRELRHLGLAVLAADEQASPAVVTIVLPPKISSRSLGLRLQRAGYLLSYGSEYLLKRNWIQICIMGMHSREHLADLLEQMGRMLKPAAKAPVLA
jgi:aspartate aminotransferase-like enzyme